MLLLVFKDEKKITLDNVGTNPNHACLLSSLDPTMHFVPPTTMHFVLPTTIHFVLPTMTSCHPNIRPTHLLVQRKWHG
jgi:hypothetical protein